MNDRMLHSAPEMIAALKAAAAELEALSALADVTDVVDQQVMALCRVTETLAKELCYELVEG
jgi:hypothetical protein